MRLVKAAADSFSPSRRCWSRPWLEASIARCVTPSRASVARSAWSCTGSGVVSPASRVKPGETMPSVPTLAASRPSAVQMWRTKWTVELLPLVPVTAAMVAGCRPANVAAISAMRRRGLASRTTTMPLSNGGSTASDPARITEAPRLRIGDEARTVGFGAGRAAKRKPGWTLRRVERQAGTLGSRGKALSAHELTQPQRDALPVRPPPDRRRAPAAPCVPAPGRDRRRHDRSAAALGTAIGVDAISSGVWLLQSPGRMP